MPDVITKSIYNCEKSVLHETARMNIPRKSLAVAGETFRFTHPCHPIEQQPIAAARLNFVDAQGFRNGTDVKKIM